MAMCKGRYVCKCIYSRLSTYQGSSILNPFFFIYCFQVLDPEKLTLNNELYEDTECLEEMKVSEDEDEDRIKQEESLSQDLVCILNPMLTLSWPGLVLTEPKSHLLLVAI